MNKGISILLNSCASFLLLSFSEVHAISVSGSGFGAGGSLPTLSLTPTTTPSLTPTTTNTTTTVDSGQVRPPGGLNSSTTVSSKFSGLDVPSQAVLDEQYSSGTTPLPLCPTNPICPDINGKMPDGTTPSTPPASCPNVCRVDRLVKEVKIGQVVSIETTKAAVCPSSYVTAGVYNVGKEILLNTNPAPAPYPVPDIKTFDEYMNAGYKCETYYAGTYEQCGGSFSATVGNPPSPFTSYPSPAPATVAGGYLGYFTANNSDPNYCAMMPYCYYYCDASLVDTDTKYSYPYSYIKCTPPPGLYYSGNMVPTSLVCAVRKPTWKKLN